MLCLVAVASARPQRYNDLSYGSSYDTVSSQSYSDITDESDPRFGFDVRIKRNIYQTTYNGISPIISVHIFLIYFIILSKNSQTLNTPTNTKSPMKKNKHTLPMTKTEMEVLSQDNIATSIPMDPLS